MKPDRNIKRLNIRFRRKSDVDLIERAAAHSGLPVSEWLRRSAIKTAEEQIHRTGAQTLSLKNILLIRRILEIANVIPDDALNMAKDWARIQAEDAVRVDDTPTDVGEQS